MIGIVCECCCRGWGGVRVSRVRLNESLRLREETSEGAGWRLLVDPICLGEGNRRSRRLVRGVPVLPIVPMWRTLVLVQVSDSRVMVR